MAWISALITAVAALALAVYNQRRTYLLTKDKAATDRELVRLQADQQERLKKVESQLTGDLAKESAKIAYEYDALKRLYTSARPLMFRPGELCEDSNRRIDKLMSGYIKLHPESNSIRSTTYRLTAPLVIVRTLGQRLTTIDLRVDDVLRNQYRVARELTYVLQNGNELSCYPPAFPDYLDPDKRGPRQHLTLRQFDGLIESLTRHNSDGSLDLKSNYEFEQQSSNESTETSQRIGPMLDLLGRANPDSPVLWRALMVLRILQKRLLQLLEEDSGFPTGPYDKELVEPENQPYKKAYCDAVDAATKYLKDRNLL
jgi:hypothetical protein